MDYFKTHPNKVGWFQIKEGKPPYEYWLSVTPTGRLHDGHYFWGQLSKDEFESYKAALAVQELEEEVADSTAVSGSIIATQLKETPMRVKNEEQVVVNVGNVKIVVRFVEIGR